MSKKIVIIIVVLALICSLGYLAKRVGIIEIGQPQEEMVQEKPVSEPKEEIPRDETLLEEFAKCLKGKGIKFYGTSGCGWCSRQKQLFGEAAKYLPYVECVNEKTQQLAEECQKAEISAFPTWEFSDGEKEAGFKTLEKLAELSGCELK